MLTMRTYYTVTCVAQVMVMAADHLSENTNTAEQQRQQAIDNDAFLLKALEAFLGKAESQIQDTILQTLEGHLRAILGE